MIRLYGKHRNVIMFGATVSASERSFHSAQFGGLLAAGWEVHSFSSGDHDSERWAAELGITHHSIEIARMPRPLADLRSFLRLLRLYASVRPSTTVLGTPKASLLGLCASFLVGVPRRIYVVHGLRYEGYRGFRRTVFKSLEKVSNLLATESVVVSPSVRSELLKMGLDPRKIRLVGSGSVKGVDASRFKVATPASRESAREALGLSRSGLVLAFVGRLSYDKGVLEVLETVRLLRDMNPQWSGLLVGPMEGDDRLRLAVEEAIAEGSLSAVGQLDSPEVAFAASNVIILPSRREGLGQVLIEAAMAGLPSVASRVTGCVDAVSEGLTGELVDSWDPRDWAVAVTRVAEITGLEGERRKWAIDNFDSSAVNKAWVRIFCESLDPLLD